MTDDERRAITEGLAKWMGWDYTVDKGGDVWHVNRVGHNCVFWPFHSLDASRLLLVECKDRGLMREVIRQLARLLTDIIPYPAEYLLVTAEQITLAVWAMVKEQGKGSDEDLPKGCMPVQEL